MRKEKLLIDSYLPMPILVSSDAVLGALCCFGPKAPVPQQTYRKFSRESPSVERPDPCNTRPHDKPRPHCPHGTPFLRRRRPWPRRRPFCGLRCLTQPVLSLFMAALPCAAYVVPPFGYSALRCLLAILRCLRACPLFEWRISRPCTYK
jgi:hypothetical protein